MFDSANKHPFTKVIQAIILSWMLLFTTFAWSETATAIDDSDLLVAGKIIQDQQKASSVEPTTKEDVQPLQVENDLADGQSIRSLPTLNEPVIDQAHILSVADKQRLNAELHALNDQAKAQIGIIIVPTTGQEDIFGFAMRVADEWKLGLKQRSNGILIALAVNDRRVQIVTGYGLEGILPDIIVSRIIQQHMTPYFKQNQFAQGLESGVAEIQRIINLDPEIAEQAAKDLKEQQEQALKEQQARENTFNMALFILIAGIVGSFVVGKRLSAATAAVAGFTAGMVNGAGLLMSVLIGGGIFFLLITTIAQAIFQAVLSGSSHSRGGGMGGSGGRGGGYRGGGGGFGGGGASGSW